jgi:FtsH-binding integral membrane protein
MDQRPENSQPQKFEDRGRTRRFVYAATGLMLGAVLLFALLTRLDVFTGGFHVVTAMVLGTVGTIALAVILMGLMFYSNRSGIDDEER